MARTSASRSLTTFVIDSWAAETVIPVSWLGSHPIEESPDSRAGAYCTAANGERIENEGQRIPAFAASEGIIRKMTFQVCNFPMALGSASKICKAGHRAVFDGDGSYIEDKKTGEVAEFHTVMSRIARSQGEEYN